MAAGMYRKVGLAALIMTASVFLSRVLGVLRESTIAAIGGAGTAVDAYKVAFVLPEILNHMLASGFLSITFIPIIAKYMADGDHTGGWRIASVILTLFGLLLSALIVLAMLFAPELITLIAAGRDEPEFRTLAVRMTRILLPAQLFFFAGGIFMAVQFAKERFFIPAMAPLIYNLGIIAGGLLLTPHIGVEGFAWGALGGALIGNCLLQLIGARRVGMRYFPVFDWRHPDVRHYLLMTLPLMLGLTMTFSTEIFSKFFGSFLTDGAISHIDFAWRIMLMLVAFFGQAVGVASYPFLAGLAAEKRLADMNCLLNDTLRYLALVIPLSGLVFVLRHEIVRVLFERRAFLPSDTEATAMALAGMLVGAAAFAAQTVVNRGFYAMRNTWLPSLYGTAAVIASLPLYWFGLKVWGVLGVGLAISCSALCQVLLLFAVWNRKVNNTGSRAVYAFYGKIILMSMPVVGLLTLTQRHLLQWIDIDAFTGNIALIAVQGFFFVLFVAIATWVFKIDEARVLWRKVAQRAMGRRNAHKDTGRRKS